MTSTESCAQREGAQSSDHHKKRPAPTATPRHATACRAHASDDAEAAAHINHAVCSQGARTRPVRRPPRIPRGPDPGLAHALVRLVQDHLRQPVVCDRLLEVGVLRLRWRGAALEHAGCFCNARRECTAKRTGAREAMGKRD